MLGFASDEGFNEAKTEETVRIDLPSNDVEQRLVINESVKLPAECFTIIKAKDMSKQELLVAKDLSNNREEIIKEKNFKIEEEDEVVVEVVKEEPKKKVEKVEVEMPKVTAEPVVTMESVTIESADTQDTQTTLVYNGNFTGNTPVVSSSGLTIEQIDLILADTYMAGMGSTIYEVEQTYGINAFFTIGVAGCESGFGKSHRAKTKNDCFGQISCKFSSYEEGILHFGENLHKHYKNSVVMTPLGIDPKYSGYPDTNWSTAVVSIMNRCASKL